MNNLIAIVVTVGLAGAMPPSLLEAPVRVSGLNSCSSAFLSISAFHPRRDAFPSVDLRVTGPGGSTAGYGTHEKRIPNSTYGKVIELPKHPDRSKVVAVEICNAPRGEYELSVADHDTDGYFIGIRASTPDDLEEINTHICGGTRQRACRYRFIFRSQ